MEKLKGNRVELLCYDFIVIIKTMKMNSNGTTCSRPLYGLLDIICSAMSHLESEATLQTTEKMVKLLCILLLILFS